MTEATTETMTALLATSPVRLAPMAAFTNAAFRAVAVECGSGFTTHEEIDVDALLNGNASIEQATGIEAGRVVAMQLLGCTAETLVPAALELVEAGADIIDVNMGCPAPKVVRKGKGAALMRDVASTARVLSVLRAALDGVPLTIKIRGGWSDQESNAVEVARMAQDVGVDAITVHPRTRAQRYGGKAPWDVIADVVQAVDIPVTGNGDVTSMVEARRMIAETGCASVMIGRGALGRPWVFDESYEDLDEAGRADYEARVVTRHLELIEDLFAPREALLQAKKHLARYAAGRPGASTFRGELFRQTSIEGTRDVFARAVEATRPRGLLVR
ncbi:MAG: tRNA-dihydrouridine synthase [Dehalococcoidia bacterium]